MRPTLLALAATFLLAQAAQAQQVTGLSDWNIFLDPGHSQNENVGVYGYSEAHKTLRVGLALREMLLTETDIDTVFMSRTTDQQSVSLSQRVDHANTVGADYYHSIHSNAAGPTANNIFVLWPQYPDGSEAIPNGGQRMADLMSDRLARAMRIPDRGGIGECDFYGSASCRDRSVAPKGSRNFVQSYTVMPSTLSEAGFHTNPVQNQRNMNAEWKRLEARAMFWSILDYHNLPRPAAHIATGIISDIESGLPINGAQITVGPQSYTTDTYESLFHLYSNDPDELRNGFYYLEDLPAGTLPVTVTAPDFESFSGEVTLVDTFFTFYDVGLVSTVPPSVATANVTDGQTGFRITNPFILTFSRPVEPATVEAAFSITPSVEGTFQWADGNRRLIFTPDSLAPLTEYTLSIAATAEGAYGHDFDGNGDGSPGDAYSVTFTTGFPDATAPRPVASSPAPNSSGADVRPVISVIYSEPLEPSSVTGRISLKRTSDGAVIPGLVDYYTVDSQGVVTFFPQEELASDQYHALVIEPGIEDLFDNTDPNPRTIRFATGTTRYLPTVIDNFEQDVAGNWWEPQQSGSTSGIVTDSTGRSADSVVVNRLYGGANSLAVRYGWDDTAPAPLARVCFEGCGSSTVRFDDSYLLQAYVFGDGSGNRFRFAIDDNLNGSPGTEVSPWYTVDWKGWRLVTWDIRQDGAGSWIGNEVIEGALRFESLQLTHTPGSPRFGTFYFDDLRVARRQDVSVSNEAEEGAPRRAAIHPNTPNPFRSTTAVRFDVPASGPVVLRVYNMTGAVVATLLDQPMQAGTHTLTWHASDLSSGVYVLRLDAGGEVVARKVVLVR